jgi:two-component system CheB/CheR fusion protein
MKMGKKPAAPAEPRRRQQQVKAAPAKVELATPIPEPPEPAVVPGFPIVGLGASAGGLQALEEFFSNMPPDSGMAFVVVTHLHPDQPSMLHELVGRKTTMPVAELRKSTVVAQNHIYTITPGRNLAILNGTLQPMTPDRTVPLQLPIDYFFRSLAQDQKDRAIGIILSGTGSDGTLGLKEIKGALGMVMVQREESASYPGMPQSAIATGLVDYVLAPAEMPEKLVAYVKDAYGAPARVARRDEGAPHPEALQQIFVLLRARTRHDFSQYKGSTINRRIERRMNVHHLDSLKRYVRFLQDNPGEIDLLFKELLIGVTSFFRDPDAFEGLAAALTALLTRKPDNYGVRIWVPGCSSGEEAYSIAILVREFTERMKKPLSVQIFATDLDSDAIDVARAGVYPLGIANDVTPKRLKRFFVRDEDAFRVTKELREMVVFAPQNLIEDPPFTKVDLLSCRNLLIYLDGALQRRLLPIFHYSLRPEGLLFLGSSESIGSFNYLFSTLDKKWKVFQRKEVAEGTYLAEFPAGIRGTPPPDARALAPLARLGDATVLQGADKLIMRELLPPTVIIRERGDIVHIHGRTGPFLELTPGPQPVANIFNMARDGLQLEVASLVRQAAVSDGEVIRREVRFKPNGGELVVDLRARRISDPEPFRGLLMISFEGLRPLVPLHEKKGKGEAKPRPSDRVTELERDLQYTKESHQKTIEELETTNEELKSTNEELQSTNEELQSANEELETSKEEMQSLNEELQTVNAELSGKVEELSRANDDMKNLLNATDIATIFLDNELNITRYTEQAKRIMRLIPSDVGRPIVDLVPRLRYAKLAEDAREVLSTLIFKEVEVQGEENSWYFMRILPYRTTDNVIDGLVMTFIDITKVKVLQENQQRLMHALQSSPTTVFGMDRDLRYTWIASGAFGRPPEAILGKKDTDLFDVESSHKLTDLKRRAMEGTGGVRHTTNLTVGGESRLFDFYLEAMRDDAGKVVGVTGVHTDVTSVVERK